MKEKVVNEHVIPVMDNLPAQRINSPVENSGLAVIGMFLDACQGIQRNEEKIIAALYEEARLSGLTDPSNAEKGVFFYSWKQGKGYIEGPTVKCTDFAARIWGLSQQTMVYDIFVATAVKDQDTGETTIEQKPFLEFHTYTFDPITKRFNHTITRQAKRVNVGEWAEKNPENADRAAAAVFAIGQSKASRNGVIHNIGKHIFDNAVKEAREAVHEGLSRNAKGLVASLEKCFAAFDSEFGITKDRVIAYIGRDVKRMSEKDLIHLRGVFTRIADGGENAEKIFPLAGPVVEKAPAQDVVPTAEEAQVTKGKDPYPAEPQQVAEPEQKPAPAEKKPNRRTKHCYVCKDGPFFKTEVKEVPDPDNPKKVVYLCEDHAGNDLKGNAEPQAAAEVVHEVLVEPEAKTEPPAGQPDEITEMVETKCSAFCGETKPCAPLYDADLKVIGNYCSECQHEALIHCKGTPKIQGCGSFLTAIHKRGGQLFKRKDGMVCSRCIGGA